MITLFFGIEAVLYFVVSIGIAFLLVSPLWWKGKKMNIEKSSRIKAAQEESREADYDELIEQYQDFLPPILSREKKGILAMLYFLHNETDPARLVGKYESVHGKMRLNEDGDFVVPSLKHTNAFTKEQKDAIELADTYYRNIRIKGDMNTGVIRKKKRFTPKTSNGTNLKLEINQ